MRKGKARESDDTRLKDQENTKSCQSLITTISSRISGGQDRGGCHGVENDRQGQPVGWHVATTPSSHPSSHLPFATLHVRPTVNGVRTCPSFFFFSPLLVLSRSAPSAISQSCMLGNRQCRVRSTPRLSPVGLPLGLILSSHPLPRLECPYQQRAP